MYKYRSNGRCRCSSGADADAELGWVGVKEWVHFVLILGLIKLIKGGKEVVKIIGFKKLNGKFDGYHTPTGLLASQAFRNACMKTADVIGSNFIAVFTKRQASKFLSGKGIVFNTIFKKKEVE